MLAGQPDETLEALAAVALAFGGHLLEVDDRRGERTREGPAPQLVERLTDLGLGEERPFAPDPMGDAGSGEGLLEEQELGVRAGEDGHA